ncbi:MAG: hypothetical protein ACO1OB_04690 [Archangium sp.]
MRWLLVLVISVASNAWAHDADVIYAFVESSDDTRYLLTEHLTMTEASLLLLAPIDVDRDGAISRDELQSKGAAIRAGVWDDAPLTGGGTACELLETEAFQRQGFVELTARYSCRDGELRQDFRFLRVLPANYRVVLGSQLDGERAARGVAQGSLSAVRIPRPLSRSDWNPDAFFRGFDAGLARGFAVDVLALVACLMFSLADWKRGLRGLGWLAAGLLLGGFVDELWLVALALAFFGAAFAAYRPLPLFGLFVGVGIGLRGGGDAWSQALGLGVGTLLIAGAASLAFVAVGVMLARRPAAKHAKWVMLGVAAVAALASRLS